MIRQINRTQYLLIILLVAILIVVAAPIAPGSGETIFASWHHGGIRMKNFTARVWNTWLHGVPIASATSVTT
jgi:hypothetical protein